MVAVRGCGVPRAPRLLVAMVVGVLGCRGDAGEAIERATARADDKLAWPALDEPSLIAMVMTGGFELGAPAPLAITPDGAVLFRRSKPRDPSADLYQLDPAGKTTVLASAAALLGPAKPTGAAAGSAASAGPAGAPGIETIEVSADGTRVLVPLAGRLFVVERATGAARELAIGAHRDPRLSPDGKRVAFVRDGDLWVAAIGEAGAPGAAPTRLAAHPPDREYATPEAAAQDFGRRHGFWWSPDGQSIAFQRSDVRAVDTLYLGDPRHPEQPPAAVRFPRSGRPNATIDLGIVSVRGGAPRWVTWDVARYPYLARVIWPGKGPLSLIVVSRDQTQLAVLAVDPAGGTRALLDENDPAWLNVAPDALTWLGDGSGFLWMTERDGAWSLEHHAADGKLVRKLVTADAGLRRVVAVSPDGHDVLIEAASDPREHHVWRVALAGDPPAFTALTSGGGIHRAIANHGVIVISSANRAGGRVTAALRADGSRVELPSVAERPAAPTTKLESVTLDDHAQYAAITRPRAFAAKVRYPVLLRLGPGPDSRVVLDAIDSYAVDQWWADAGFIVVRSDGRGAPGHDRPWQRVIAGDVLTIPMNDQIGALERLGASYPELDLDRVGAIGSGYGGYLATVGAMIHPDAFAAAVAVSPITDWELLGAAFAERFMKTPATNAEGYRRANASSYAEQLKRPLLIMHGATDRRIHFAHTLELLEALSSAGKRVELAALPAGHDATREIATTRLQLEFLRTHLGPPVRPAVMPEARSEEDEERERERARAGGGKDEERERERERDRDRDDKDRDDKDRKDRR